MPHHHLTVEEGEIIAIMAVPPLPGGGDSLSLPIYLSAMQGYGLE